MTPLMRAARGGCVDIIRKLIKKKANLEMEDNKMCSALIWAIDYNRVDAARLLLLSGADVDKASVGGWTPLMWASKHGHVHIVHLLLRHNADKDIKSNTGMTAIDLSRRLRHQRGHNQVARLLSEERMSHPEGHLSAPALLAHYDGEHVADYEWDLHHGIIG